MLNAAAERIRHEFFGERFNKLIRPAFERLPQIDRTGDRTSIDQLSGRIDERAGPAVFRAPCADRIEILERESERVHNAMTSVARWLCPVLFHDLAHGLRLLAFLIFFESLDV